MRSFQYNERLQYLNLDSLQCRRVKADLIMCYKILLGLVDLEASRFFTRSLYPTTRGNLFKLAKLPVVSERDKKFLIIVLLIYGIRYLTILLRLVLSLASKETLMDLIFRSFKRNLKY